jgi:hypothetical protein
MKDECDAKINNDDVDSDSNSEEDDDEYEDEFGDRRTLLFASVFMDSRTPGEEPKETGSGVAYIVNPHPILGDWWGLMDGPDKEF